jgi:glycosyltransferase involved in cell wall biosynthesis
VRLDPRRQLSHRRSSKPTREILVFADYYLPGFKAGGPIRCLANIVDRLGNDFEFKIVTRDRDYGDIEPYTAIPPNLWHSKGKATLLYLSPDRLRPKCFRRVIEESGAGVVYLNSFFSPRFTIQVLLMRWAGMLPPIQFVVAPRGELSPNALQLKRSKKLPYLALARALRFYEGVLWQASNQREEKDIQRWFGAKARTAVVPDVSAYKLTTTIDGTRERKQPGRARLVFASRISRIKNLDGALKCLSRASGRIDFDIYGPIEDAAYWNTCGALIAALPSNVTVTYRGAIQNDEVASALGTSHFFFLPTLSESYGHAIIEAMLAGCPVIISDQTPWRRLEEKRVGWDIPLTAPELFEKALQTCVDMDDATYQLWAASARAHATDVLHKDRSPQLTRMMFESMLTQSADG